MNDVLLVPLFDYWNPGLGTTIVFLSSLVPKLCLIFAHQSCEFMLTRLMVSHKVVSDIWDPYGSFLSQTLGCSLFPVNISVLYINKMTQIGTVTIWAITDLRPWFCSNNGQGHGIGCDRRSFRAVLFWRGIDVAADEFGLTRHAAIVCVFSVQLRAYFITTSSSWQQQESTIKQVVQTFFHQTKLVSKLCYVGIFILHYPYVP